MIVESGGALCYLLQACWHAGVRGSNPTLNVGFPQQKDREKCGTDRVQQRIYELRVTLIFEKAKLYSGKTDWKFFHLFLGGGGTGKGKMIT